MSYPRTDDDALAAPVRVEVVNHPDTSVLRPKAPRRVTTEQFVIDPTGGPVRILGANPHRCRAKVFATSTGAGQAFVGGQGLTTGSGFPTSSLVPLEFTTTEALYAVATAGGVVTVFVLSEHYDG